MTVHKFFLAVLCFIILSGFSLAAPPMDEILLEAVAAYENHEFKEAASLFADIDAPEAYYYLGLIYEYGRGAKADYPKAAAYYQKAANAGHVKAMRQLGLMYRVGRGIAQNSKTATSLVMQAAKAGDYKAARLVSFYYQDGLHGLAQDPEKYIYWQNRFREAMKNAALAGDVEAMYDFGEAYLDFYPNDWLIASEEENMHRFNNPLFWLEKAAAGNNIDAISRLMQIYAVGNTNTTIVVLEPDKNKLKAMSEYFFALLQKGAEQNDARSMASLGTAYYLLDPASGQTDNMGQPAPDIDKAFYWLNAARQSGQVDALGHYHAFRMYQLAGYHMLRGITDMNDPLRDVIKIMQEDEELLSLGRQIGELGDMVMMDMLIRADTDNSTYWQQKLNAINK